MPNPRRCVRTRLRRPLEDSEGAEAARVGERLGLGDAAAGLHRVEVADTGALGPDPAAFFYELVDAVQAQPVRLRGVARRRWELVDGDLARDVLRAQIGERVTSPLVATIRAEPLGPRSGRHRDRGVGVVQNDDPSAE